MSGKKLRWQVAVGDQAARWFQHLGGTGEDVRLAYKSGRHFLQIPGPTNVPDRVLRAMDMPTIDHRGPQFQALARRILTGLPAIFGTESPVVIYPASGTGAWEAALVNTLSPGDRVLMYETGHFATLWNRLAGRLGRRHSA
jgi:alanine-glyoxylate transaminase/serine-glyoxylate transaminase/serine-pyruvate transaminase